MAKLKHMFKKTAVLFRDREDRNQEKKEPSAPEGLWLKCPKCGEVVYRDDVKAHGYVCPKCEDISGSEPEPGSAWLQTREHFRSGLPIWKRKSAGISGI